MADQQERQSYIVGAIKIPHVDRDVAHAVITPEDDRGFLDMIGADTADHDAVFPVGTNTTYRVELTEGEAERFRAASNARYVELDTECHDTVGAVSFPAASSMRFMRADFPRVDQYHGRDVIIGLLDGGTTAAVRAYLGVEMLGKQTFGPDAPGADEITSEHGCLVAPCLIPTGGKFLDAIVSSNTGTRSVSASVAAAIWCADNGAQVINYSGSGSTDSSAWHDMLDNLLARGRQFFAAMGNSSANSAGFPAALAPTYANLHSSISFDEQTNTKSSFTNYTSTASGCAPGTAVLGLHPDGQLTTWSGTSASAPHMARLCAMGCTGARYTPAQVGAALKANCRDTGQPTSDQGGGAYSLEAALTALGGFDNLPALDLRTNLNNNPSFEVNTTGYSVAARTGITATTIGRFSTVATPFGTFYASTNISGDGSTSTEAPDVEVTLPPCAVTAGKTYTFSVHSRHSIVDGFLQWLVQFKDSGGGVLDEVNGAVDSLLPTVWARYHVTATAPTGATSAALFLQFYGFTEATARSWRWDGFHYEQTLSLKPYFDGSTTGGAWTGTANNSTSTIGTTPVVVPPPASTTPGGTVNDPRAVLIVKAPTGTSNTNGNYYAATAAAAGLVLSGAAYRIGGHGPQLVMLERADVGVTGDPDELDGTGLSIGGAPGGGTTPGGGTPPGGGGGTGGTTPGDILKIGLASGFAKFNVGVGFLPGDPLDRDGDGHVDFTLAEIDNGLVVPGHFELSADGLRVKMTSYASGGTTSPRTANSRTEFRELKQSGDGSASHPKADFSITSGTHKCFARGRVLRAPAQKPEIVMVQSHDSTDDTSMLRYHHGNLQCRIKDTVLSIGTIPWNLNTDYDYGIVIEGASSPVVKFFFGPVGAPIQVASGPFGRTTTQYFKTGLYGQFNETNVDADEYGVIELTSVMCWHTGDPEPVTHLG